VDKISEIPVKESKSGLLEKTITNHLFSFTAFLKKNNLLFVIDNTKNEITPNTRLVLEEEQNQKWDEILKERFKINPESIRPKDGHLYQPLDIEYENLHLYKNYLENLNDDFLAKKIVLNREKQALKHCISRLDKETETLHKSQATVMSSRKSVNDFSEKLKRSQARQKALEKKKKENPKSVKPEQENKVFNQIEKNNEDVKSRKKRLRRAEKRVEKSKEKIVTIKKLLHLIKEKLSVYKKEELDAIEEKPVEKNKIILRPTAPFVQKQIEKKRKKVAPPTPLPYVPNHSFHFLDNEKHEHGIHLFHLISLILIALLILLFIILRQ